MNIESRLRKKILCSLTKQGFKYNPHLRPKNNSKYSLRLIHKQSRLEKLNQHTKLLSDFKKTIKEYAISGSELNPEEIKLELRQVESNSLEAKIFLWWNLAWWSIPFERPIGRQMRYLLWDKTHDAPFGLIGLQSPPLRMSVRDKYLEIPRKELDFWVNQSLNGQRVGALPPYNELLGGKFVAMALTSNEIRNDYSKKYSGKKSWMENRILPSKLLFVTTSSAFGKSSMYERIKFYDENIGKFVGYTAGAGSFFISDKIYHELLDYLSGLGYDTTRGYGTGSSRKLQFMRTALIKIGIKSNVFHGIKRGYYLFSNVTNLKQVIKENRRPKWHNRPFDEMQEFWLERYAIPRAARNDSYKKFKISKIFQKLNRELKN